MVTGIMFAQGYHFPESGLHEGPPYTNLAMRLNDSPLSKPDNSFAFAFALDKIEDVGLGTREINVRPLSTKDLDELLNPVE